MTSTRVITVGSLVVLAGLIAGAAVLSITPASQTGVDAARLRVGSGPPPTATGLLTYSSNQGTSLTAQLALSGPEDAASATVTASNGLVEASLRTRAVGGVLYVDVAQFASQLGAPWTALPLSRVRVSAAAALAQLRRPDLAALGRFGALTRRTANGAVTVVHLTGLRFPPLGSLPLGLPPRANATVTLTTGPEGQLYEIVAHLVGPAHSARITATLVVTGYGQRVVIHRPARDQVVTLTRARAKRLFGVDARALDHLLGDLGGLGSTKGAAGSP